jgi:hypothetical protein
MDWWNARPHPGLLPLGEGEIISAFLKIYRARFTRLVRLQGQSPRQAHDAKIRGLNFWDSTRSKRRMLFKIGVRAAFAVRELDWALELGDMLPV